MRRLCAHDCSLAAITARVLPRALCGLNRGAFAFFAQDTKQYNITLAASRKFVAHGFVLLLWALVLLLPATAHPLLHPTDSHDLTTAKAEPLLEIGIKGAGSPLAGAPLLATHGEPKKDENQHDFGAHDCSFCAGQKHVGAAPVELRALLVVPHKETLPIVAVWQMRRRVRFHQPPSRAPPHLG